MPLAKPCTDCGELTHHGTRCQTCTQAKQRRRTRETTTTPKTTAHQRGYTSRWTRLSAQARKLQPFCTDCGATTDLQADHSPEAWKRHNQGLEIRLQDIDVVCGDCNRRRGAARGKHARNDSKPTNPLSANSTQPNRDRPPQGHTDTQGGVPSAVGSRLGPQITSLGELTSGRVTNTGSDWGLNDGYQAWP